MVSRLLFAWCLMAVSVAIHAVGLTTAFRWVKRRRTLVDGRFWHVAWTMICIAAWAILLHLLEIAAWACFYAWKGAMPDLASALYFSAVTYTTTGYGDLLLAPPWRLVGAVEALTGILMCGWSTGFFFAIVSRMYETSSPHGSESTVEPGPPP